MFRSTDDTAASGAETVSSDGMATPYFMLIQMNNAALLEAYATLGIAPRSKKVNEQKYPDGFSLGKALAPIAFGEQDKSEHPGKLHKDDKDFIAEAEKKTKGKAANALALGQQIASRFASNSGDGGDFGKMISAAMAAASLPQLDFDPDIFATGAAVLASSGGQSSATPDFAGSAPFTGMRPDYRPENAPAGPKRTTVRRHSKGAAHLNGDENMIPSMLASMYEIAKGRKRGAGTGKVIRPEDHIKGIFGL